MKRIFSLLGWFFVLALAAVGLRNFESGLSIDAPLYATIARNLASGASSSWWLLKTSIPEFQPYFADHPHLSFWSMAAVFKLLPAADWTARIPSQISYVLSLLLVFVWVADLARSRRAAALSVALFWAFPILGNYFSNGYMDPQAFLLGAFAVYALDRGTRPAGRVGWALVSGLALAACALTKGFTVLGFGPAMAYLVLSRALPRPSLMLRQAILCLGVAALVLGLYAWGLSASEVPDFLETYFRRQWSERFAVESDWSRLVGIVYYRELARETHWLLVLVPLALAVWRQRALDHWDANRPNPNVWRLPLILWISFTLMYVPAGRLGQQYWIMLLPWAAWVLGAGLDALLPEKWTEVRIRKVTIRMALVVVIAVQFLPIRVHHSREHALAAKLPPSSKLWIEGVHNPLTEQQSFIHAAEWAWYSKTDVAYMSSSEIISGARSLGAAELVVLSYADEKQLTSLVEALLKQGLCLGAAVERKAYWRHCS